MRCAGCHGLYQRPVLLPQGNPYDGHDVEEYFSAHELPDAVANGRELGRRARELFGRPGRMLELGCGRGALIKGAADEGWSVRGVEMTPGFAAEGHGLDIEVAPIETARSLGECYDAVILAAILEHLYDPRECLRRVHAALSPGGVLFIDVPNECSLWAGAGNFYMRLRGRPWVVNLSPTFSPFHVVGFCPRSLRLLLGRAGFVVRELRTWRYRNLLPPRPGLAARLEDLASGGLLSIGQWIGRGAGVTCWAQKA